MRNLITAIVSVFVVNAGEVSIQPVLRTQGVNVDADDPAIWINMTDTQKSLIIGTDKGKGSTGGIYVFDLGGRIVNKVDAMDQPNNVDVEYRVSLLGKQVDLVGCTERGKQRLRLWSISSDGTLTDVGGDTTVLVGEEGERSHPMGISFYVRPSDGKAFVFVSPKAGPTDGYIWQYELVERSGKLDLKFLRRFGACQEGGEIEALCVDDEAGFLYAAEEGFGIRKFMADPEVADANRELALFATEPHGGDREGLAIYDTGDGTGLLVSTEQIENGSRYRLYDRRKTETGCKPVGTLVGEADSTDGIEVVSRPLGPGFENGLFAAMNSKDKNFFLFSGDALAKIAKSLN